MTQVHINDFWLTEYCNDIARDISMDAQDIEQAMDWAHEAADGCEYVIYTYKAHAVCQQCNTDTGHEQVRDCYGDTFLDYDQQASVIAYFEICSRIEAAIHSHFDEWQAEAEAQTSAA